jgi:two-component system chemotaxis sensor kinase CheA
MTIKDIMTIRSDENLQLYIEESLSQLTDIENDLLAIEAGGADIDEETVNKVFRAAHSIKGGAGFMGLSNIKELSHKMENVLGMIRSRELVPTSDIVTQLLHSTDTLRDLLSNASTSNDADILNHMQPLPVISVGCSPEGEKKRVSNVVDIYLPDDKVLFNVAEYDIIRARNEGKCIYIVEFDLIHDVHNKNKIPLEFISELMKGGTILDCKIDIEAAGFLEEDKIINRLPFVVLLASILERDMIGALVEVDGKHIFELARDMTVTPLDQTVSDETVSLENRLSIAPKGSPNIPGKKTIESVAIRKSVQQIGTESAERTVETEKKRTTAAEISLRVSVGLLDSLINLAGELVLGRNQLLQAVASKNTRAIEVSAQCLDIITTELQEAIMRARMQPIGSVFNKFPRVVRDLAGSLGKQVEITLDGIDVELDKTIIEALSDPLAHLVRNAIDHGIETPGEREMAKKPPAGKVLLKAYCEADIVNIEIADDGRGIDGNQIASAAIAKDLISENRVRLLSDKEKINLIFLPGFSTAPQVTEISGRGVGMDVVKTNLDKLGGVVDIESQAGQGATIRIKLPLTLAIITSQLVSTGGERFAIPMANMDELLRIPASQVKERVEKIGDAVMVRLRGRLLPLLCLSDLLGIEKTYVDPETGEIKPDRRHRIADRRSGYKPAFEENNLNQECTVLAGSVGVRFELRSGRDRRFRAQSALNIVVVSAGVLKYGLLVDTLLDSEEIVVKPLGRHLTHCKGYAGATIMGDGRVALILDVMGLAQMAELTSVQRIERAAEVVCDGREAEKADSQSLLIFRNAEDQQFAVPLGLVQRIKKINRSDIEEFGGRRVLQYRGRTLPLATLEDVANVEPLADREEVVVIVFLIAGREAGLLATEPMDAVDVRVTFDEKTLNQQGIMGSAIIGQHTTLMIDIFEIMKMIYPHWFSERE